MKTLSPLGVADAAGQIQAFVLVIGHGATRRIDLDCVCQRTVSADERRLVAVLALVQHARLADAASVLRPLLRASAVPAALDSGGRLMASFSAAGQRLQPPDSIAEFECRLLDCRLRAASAPNPPHARRVTPDERTAEPITVH